MSPGGVRGGLGERASVRSVCHDHPVSDSTYIHGTSEREQGRLINQVDQIGKRLPPNLDLNPGERLLEIGCGVGAVLGSIGLAHPDVELVGIDISPEQIAGARRHLNELGLDGVELAVGDGANLPWPDDHFDRVRVVWVLEHLSDALPVLQEAWRVLRPGGTIHLTETDYASLRVSPPDPAVEVMLGAFVDHFNRHGNAHAGPSLGTWLEQAGFTEVSSLMVGIHHWCPSERDQVQEFGDYLLEFMRPELPAMQAAAPDAEVAAVIAEGMERFGQLAQRPDGAISVSVYQARGMKPPAGSSG